jgi:hypothetical protein
MLDAELSWSRICERSPASLLLPVLDGEFDDVTSSGELADA